MAAKPSLEQQLAQLSQQLTAANQQISDLTADREAAEARVTALEGDLSTVTAERDAAAQRADAAESSAQGATGESQAIRTAIGVALEMTAEQIEAFAGGDRAPFTAQLEVVALRRATEIAASQGVPPVPGGNSGAGAANEIQETFAAAAAEPDPLKRAQMFAAASAKLMKTATE